MKYLLIFISIIFIHLQTFTQEVIIEDALISHRESLRPCLAIQLDPEPKTIKKAWKDYLDDNYDFKIKGIGFLVNKDLLSAEGVIIEQISPKTMDFYTHIVESESGSSMKVFAALGYDIYINPDNRLIEYNAMYEMLTGFLQVWLPNYYQEQVQTSQEYINDLNDEIADLKEEVREDKEDIEKLKKDIQDHIKKVEENEIKLIDAQLRLEQQLEKLTIIQSELTTL